MAVQLLQKIDFPLVELVHIDCCDCAVTSCCTNPHKEEIKESHILDSLDPSLQKRSYCVRANGLFNMSQF